MLSMRAALSYERAVDRVISGDQIGTPAPFRVDEARRIGHQWFYERLKRVHEFDL